MKSPHRMAFIYAAEGKPTIVAPLYFNSAGIYYEQDAPAVVANDSWDVVVPHLREALAGFVFRDANLREGCLTDWPSYRVSGERSVRRFQHNYLCIQVRAVNEAELFYDASSKPPGEPDIVLHVTLNPHGPDEEIGRLLAKLFSRCLCWPEALSE
jgi:hypothetical protein